MLTWYIMHQCWCRNMIEINIMMTPLILDKSRAKAHHHHPDIIITIKASESWWHLLFIPYCGSRAGQEYLSYHQIYHTVIFIIPSKHQNHYGTSYSSPAVDQEHLFIPCCRSGAGQEYFPGVTQHLSDTKRQRGVWGIQANDDNDGHKKCPRGPLKMILSQMGKFFLLSIVILMSWERGSQGYDCCRQNP